jgi:AcrR family transcriptional regulator
LDHFVAARRARVLRDQGPSSHREALHRHLVQVTQRLLAAHGLSALTTRGIAREAEVSDGVLYNHFADKDELVVAALTEQFADLGTRYGPRCPRPGEQDLRTGLTAAIHLTREYLTEALPLVGGLISRPDLVHRLFAAVHADDQAPPLLWLAVRDYLVAEQHLGNVAAEVGPATVAHLIFGACQLPVLAALLGRDGGGEARLAAMGHAEVEPMVEVLLRACAPTG